MKMIMVGAFMGIVGIFWIRRIIQIDA